jgi:hypothetical protein
MQQWCQAGIDADSSPTKYWPKLGMASIQEPRRGILLLALASVNLRILRPTTVVRLLRIFSRTSQG